jgi:PPP family 3-phenylpropionic acid transporter
VIRRGVAAASRLWGSIGFIVAVMGNRGTCSMSLPLPSLLWVIVGTLAGILIYALAVPEAPIAAILAERARPGRNDLSARVRVRALFAACFAMSAAHGALYVFYSIHLDGSSLQQTFLVG